MDREAILRESAEANLLQESNRRRFVYADVESLIENGFLTHVLDLGGTPVTLRSFLPSDLLRIKARVGRNSEPFTTSKWSVASAMWVVDGFELSLDPKDNAAFHVYNDWVQSLSRPLLEVLTSNVVGLRNRVSRAIRLTEAFCYEPYSRGMWRMFGRSTQGLENSSVVKRLWVAHNLSEDLTVEETRTWVHTRAIVSSMASKGAKQLATALQQAENREEQRRRTVIEEAINWVIQGEKKDQKPLIIRVNGKDVEVPKIHSPSSQQELEAEMKKVFSGEKDFHDMLVDQYHAGIRQRVETARTERMARIMEARRLQDEAIDNDMPAMVGYTREQLNQLNPKILEQKTTAQVPESAQSNFLFDRYFKGDLRPGVLTPNMQVVDPDREKDKFARSAPKVEGETSEGGNLQELISKRKPKLQGG